MTAHFTGLTSIEALAFAKRWLPAWTGGDAERLAAFYAPDTFYRDPHVVDGIRGQLALTRYLQALLAANSRWVWTQTSATPLEGGFLNHWHADIPTRNGHVACTGVCTVILDDDGLIARNEVFFDPSPVLRAGKEP